MGNANEIFATEDSDVGSNDLPNLNKDESELEGKSSCSSSTSNTKDEETKSKEFDDTDHIMLQTTNNSPTELVSNKEHEDTMNLDIEMDGISCMKRDPDPENIIQPSIDRINRLLDRTTSLEELNSAKNKIRMVLDDILSEFMSLYSKRDILQSELTNLRNASNTIQTHSTLTSHLPPPPPPPPPLPPSPQIPLLSKKKGSNAATNDSLGSMLEEAKRKLSTGENIETNADGKTNGLKIDEKKDLQIDMMKQLQNKLNNRQTRQSLKEKYKKLSN